MLLKKNKFDSDFDKLSELYAELKEVVSKSKDFVLTDNGCCVPEFGFSFDFVNEYGEEFRLSTTYVEETTLWDMEKINSDYLERKTLSNGINKKPSNERNEGSL